MKRWLRYGLVGNFLTYGVGVGFMAYLAWIIYDIGETQTTKMDEDLAKEFFTFSDSDLKESAIRAKQKETERKEKRLQKFRESSLKRMQQNKKAQLI